MSNVLVGTSSWTDKSLIESGKFYPRTATTPEDRLRFYAAQFPIVIVTVATTKINTTGPGGKSFVNRYPPSRRARPRNPASLGMNDRPAASGKVVPAKTSGA